MILEAVLTLKLIELMTPDGQIVHINPERVLSVHKPREDSRRLVSPNVRCVITMENGRFISVKNECGEVRKLLGEDE